MSFNSECLKLRLQDKARLTTLVKLSEKYSPMLDKQVLLAGVINLLVSEGLHISKSENYYCFKSNYNREFHGDVQSYCFWLYSLLEPQKKQGYNSISDTKQGVNSHENQSLGELPHNALLDEKNAVDYHKTHFGGNLK